MQAHYHFLHFLLQRSFLTSAFVINTRRLLQSASGRHSLSHALLSLQMLFGQQICAVKVTPWLAGLLSSGDWNYSPSAHLQRPHDPPQPRPSSRATRQLFRPSSARPSSASDAAAEPYSARPTRPSSSHVSQCLVDMHSFITCIYVHACSLHLHDVYAEA